MTTVAIMPKAKRDDLSCKVEAAIVKKGRIIADFKDIPLAELFSDLLRTPIDREYERVIRQAGKDLDK